MIGNLLCTVPGIMGTEWIKHICEVIGFLFME